MSAELKPGYKLTEVGVIPEDWEVHHLGGLLTGAPNYGINAPAISYDSRYPTYLRITDISEYGQFIDESKASVNHPLSGSYMLSEGDLVLARTGASVGKSYLYDHLDGELVFAGFLIRARPNLMKLEPKFLKYFTHSRPYWNWVKVNSMRSGQPGINGREYASLPLPLPPTKAEQEAIAEALSDADALIESLEQLIAKKRYIKQGAMQELLTGKKRLPGFQNQKGFKRCELGFIPEDWSCMQLPTLMIQDSSSIKIGPFGSALKKEYLTKDGFKVYGQENVYEKNMEIGDRFISCEHFRKLRSCEVKTGDFLISMMGTVGKCLIIRAGIKEGIMDSHLLRLRVDSGKLNSNFLAQLFETRIVFDQVKQLSVGGIMEGLSSKIIKSLNLPIPSVCEQIAIAEALSDMDIEIATLDTQLTKTRSLKQGMMHNLLTGRIRLL